MARALIHTSLLCTSFTLGGCGPKDPPIVDDTAGGTTAGTHSISVASTGLTFCIDNHETTQGEYAEFLKEPAAWDPPGQYPPCAGLPRKPRENIISEQQPFDAGCPPGVFLPEMKPNQPVSCVSSCDAYAFCAWAGKRLCGGIDGGPIAPSAEQFGAALSNPTIHEWGYVCSSDGKYPGGVPTTDQCVAT